MWRGRLVLGLLWVLVFTLLLEGALVLTSGRAFEWNNLALTTLVGAGVLALAPLTLPRTDDRKQKAVDEPFGAPGAHVRHGWS